ncbi:MAG: mechanosensitive ion channel domain-containing protein [Cyanobacteriota bacterium]|nr:mechanosensitive ion channel domain-containing protein [Cyanobacteriota bacterium]
MNQLLFVLLSWLGLITRAAVLWQLLAILLLMVAYRTWRLRHPAPTVSWSPVFAKLVLVAVLALVSFLLPALGIPGGLVGLFGQLALVWTGLSALRLVLRRYLPAEQVETYWIKAVAPLFALSALAGLVHRLDGLAFLNDVPMLKLFNEPLSLGQLLLLLGLPYFLVVLSDLPVAVIGWLAGRLLGLEEGNRKALELVVRYLLIAIGVLWLADQIGLNATAIAAIAGGLSVGLGFGIKEVFSNFVSGLWLLFEGALQPGEVLLFNGDVCKVRKLGLRAATLLRKSDNAELVVPNQTFFTETTTTYTGTEELRCGFLKVRADYKHDPDHVLRLLVDIAKANPLVLADPAPSASIGNLGDSAIEYGLDFWMTDPMKNGKISGELRYQILKRFKEEGIEIPKIPYVI